MNAHDTDIIDRDKALPGLHLLLDRKSLLAALRTQHALRHTSQVQVIYLRYKPGVSCVAGLIITDRRGQNRHYFARALTPERFQQSWRHPWRQALIRNGASYAPLALPEKAIMVQRAAGDRDIRYLSLLKRPSELSLLNKLFFEPVKQKAITLHFLRYKPERRAVICVMQESKPLGVLRVASKNDYGRIVQGCAIGTALGHVSLIASHADKRMLLTNWIAGKSLCPEHGNPVNADDMHSAGCILAKLHQTPFLLPNIRHAKDDVHAMWRVFNTFEIIFPEGTTRFQQLARHIEHYLLSHKSAVTLIHGDFSADQLIKPDDGGPLRIIDWDRCASGNPLADLGSFYARLKMQVISRIITASQASEALRAFQDGYGSLRTVAEQALHWYSAWALLCLACEPFRTRAENWPEQTEQLLAHVEELINEATFFCQGEEKMDTRLWALCEPLQIGPSLLAILDPPGQSLQYCRLLRNKPGRRALVEYRLLKLGDLFPHSVLGKYRHKGLDLHGYQCQLALWNNGFGDQSPVAVPQPLGLLPKWHIWLQEKVNAEPLTRLLHPDGRTLRALGSRAGEALAALQQSHALRKVASAKQWHMEDELDVLVRGIDQVAARYPHWQKRLAALLASSSMLAETCLSAPQGCTHRDFYPDQVLVRHREPDKLVMIDFDLCCLSFPALDAGNYLAHVRELALRLFQDINALSAHELAFTDAWLLRTPDGSLELINKFMTLSLVRHIFLSTRFVDRTHTTSELLRECEQQLQHWLTTS